MSLLRTVLVGVLAVLLTVTLVAGNVAVATERTVLNPDFVKTTLEEEGAYETSQTMIADAATEQLSQGLPVDDLPISVEDVVERAVTEEYLQTQVESNVDSTLAYLHGNEEELELAVNLSPVKTRAGEAVGDAIRNMTVEELISLAAEGGNTSISAMGVTFDLTTIGEMAESPETYQDARESFRADIRETVVDQMVEETFESSSNDQLLGLVIEDYDPDEYTEEEKEQMVDEREGEIKDALETRIEEEEGDRIDDRIDDQLSEINEVADQQVESLMGSDVGGENASIAEPAANMVGVGIDGLTTDMTYEEYTTELDRSKGNLADNASAFVVGTMSENVPDRIDLTEEMDQGTLDQLESARQAVVWFDRAAMGLPLLGLVLIGLIYLVSRSPATTALAAGSSLAIAGIVGFVTAQRVPVLIEDAVQSSDGGEMGPVFDLVLGIVDRVVETVGTQSLAIAAVGGLAIAVGLYLRLYGPPTGGGPSEDAGEAVQ